jgi:hypothetical protein
MFTDERSSFKKDDINMWASEKLFILRLQKFLAGENLTRQSM